MQFRERRRATSFEVILQHERGKNHVAIINVSHMGARVRVPDGTLKAQSVVSVGLQGKNYAARIVWCRGNHAGLKFEELLPIDALNAIKRSMHKYSRPEGPGGMKGSDFGRSEEDAPEP